VKPVREFACSDTCIGGLANEIKRGVERNPAFNKLLGGEITVRKYWLDIIFPPAPPPIHYVSG
jgi:hypothetical protein